jgi:SAM-dependent methyltransferase
MADGGQQQDYFGQTRPEMLQFIPAETERLLDIGCSEGRFAAAVKARLPGCEVWGVEPSPEAARAASIRLDRFVAGRFEDADLPEGYFDTITMNDVLEHIPYSEPALARVKRLLKPGGRLVLSLPNVRYYLNVRDFLVHKDWRYADFGVMDRTHLRFFTQKSAEQLLRENGFDVLQNQGINPAKLKPHYKALFTLGGKFIADMRYIQFAIVARPTAAS